MSRQNRLPVIYESDDAGHLSQLDTSRAKSNTRNFSKKEVCEQAQSHGMLSFISTEMHTQCSLVNQEKKPPHKAV